MSAQPVNNPASQKPDTPHAIFLSFLHRIQLHARVHFRDVRCPQQRDDAVAEVVAIAWKWFLRLTERGKDVRAFVSTLAVLAALAVRSGRRVCGQEKAKDVLSPRAQQRRGFVVRTLPGNALEEALCDNTRTPPDEQAAFRCDFPVWLASLSNRDCRVVGCLAQGDRTLDVANKFGLSPGRVSQLRRQFHQDWQAFCGDAPRQPE